MRATALCLAALFFVIASIADAAQSEPPKNFRDIKWGAAPAAGWKKIMGPTSDGTSMYGPAPGKKLPDFLGVTVAEEAYSFTRGKFYSGSVWMDGQDNFNKVKAALTKEFGPPSFSNEQLKLWKWKWPGKKVQVQLTFQTRFARTTVTYSDDSQ